MQRENRRRERRQLCLRFLAATLCLFGGLSQVQSGEARGERDLFVLLVNGISPGRPNVEAVGKDVEHLEKAYKVDTRDPVITTLNAANFAALKDAISASYQPSGAEDFCTFYLGTHGIQISDDDGDEADGKDGQFDVGTSVVRDDEMDDAFVAALESGHCGAGMLVMIMACHSGELIVGNLDFKLAAPHVVLTSCTQTQKSYPGQVGGHRHSLYGGNGLVRGLTRGQGRPPPSARADADQNDVVTVRELHGYAVANDMDPPADPQSTASESVLPALRIPRSGAAVHMSPVSRRPRPFCQTQDGLKVPAPARASQPARR